MKCLVLTKCYSPISIHYWLTALVYPAAKYFTEALTYLDKVKSLPAVENDSEFESLLEKIKVFKKISMQIMESVKMYNL